MRRSFFVAAPVFLFSLVGFAAQSKFVAVDGASLVSPAGGKILLRGLGIGNWLVPEGYMFHFDQWPTSPREIDALFSELVGPLDTEKFWSQYRDHYIQEADIHFLKHAGFNSIRIPFDYRLMTKDRGGFELLDRAIAWCRRAGLWVVLDLHCAPGGQTGTNIDNSWGYPWLFENPEYQRQTAALWREIALRYKDEPAVLGYDLLNEPIPTYPELKYLNPRLEPVYKQITSAIRTVDQNHIIILGGAQWDSNFEVFGPPFDPKSVYTFHKYWMSPVQREIQAYVDFRQRHHVPVYLGESGENTNDWIATFRAVLERNDIGWAFWPYKKMDAPSCAATFSRPAHWDEIIAYAKTPSVVGETEKRLKRRPSLEHSRAALADLLKQIRFENCRVNQDYLNALIEKR